MITSKQRKELRDRAARFIKYNLVHVDDSPHRIALAVALSVLVGFLPPVGFHLILLIVLCVIFKANKFVAFTFVWFNNPLTYVPIYYPSYVLGRRLLGLFGFGGGQTLEEVRGVFAELFSPAAIASGFYTPEFWRQIWGLFVQIGFELLAGGLIIGSILSLISYFAVRKLVIVWRVKHGTIPEARNTKS